ncbi:hypothetical protein GJ672_01410 [Spiribacter sp. 2438]|uniref:PilN domain-containing protein n=1 Tax=Spiribacter sp. 2438 TaxID=2666185 RepID=UPI0012AFDAE2|nr:PilN domain-containing protein [Spiribacter sp. 2438]QGM21065.1 hypothetical protein GJ672_01410 [Spiribacter sp. 2438]
MPTGVNLLPWRQQAARSRRRRFSRQLVGAFVIGIAVSAAGAKAIEHRTQAASQHHQQLQAQADQIREELETIRQLEDRMAAYQQRLDVLESLNAERPDPMDTLTDLLAELPEGTVLQRLTGDASRLQLTGTSPSPATLARYLDQLESRPAFDQARLENLVPTQNRQGRQHFRIGVRLNSRHGEEP